MNSDFIITMKTQYGTLLFWDGHGGWAFNVSEAHTYRTREQADAAIKRQDKKGMGWSNNHRIGYMTKDDLREQQEQLS